MRIFVASDVHDSDGTFKIKKPEADVAVIAGDIEDPQFLEWHRDVWRVPIVAVLGNHDFYYGTFLDRRKWKIDGVYLLERKAVEIGDVVFLCTTLWSAPPPSQRPMVARGINDFHLIRSRKGAGPLTVDEMAEEHERCARWLGRQLRYYADRKVVVVTHFLPCDAVVSPMYAGSPLNCYFSAGLDGRMRGWPMPVLWISGHSHAPHDMVLGRTRFVANPAGYVRERQLFDHNKIVEV